MRIDKPDFAAKHPNIDKAITFSNQLLQGKYGFFEKVREVKAFDYSMNRNTKQPVSGAEIVPLFSQKIDVIVKLFKPWIFWSKAIASTTPGTPVIWLNQYMLDRSVDETVGTFIHECIHIVDNNKNLSFGHGNNYAKGKKNSAPYRIEKIAQEAIAKRKE
jgi:hypothetical protein